MQKKPAPVASRMTAFVSGPFPVVALLLCHVGLGLSAVSRKSMTFDEPAHLAGGLTYWAVNDYRLHPENGNWSQRWSALPLWLTGCDVSLEGGAWKIADVWGIGTRLLYESGHDADSMLWRARLMMAAASASLGLLVYVWSRRLFAATGGVISLTLYAFSPTMLANGFLATSDLLAALFFAASTGALWIVLHHVSPLTVLASCFTVAGVLLSKFSGVLIAPMALLLVGVRLLNPQPLRVEFGRSREVVGRLSQLAVIAGVALVEILGAVAIIYASYGFRYSAFATTQQAQFLAPWQRVEAHSSASTSALVEFSRDHHLLPEAFLYGFSHTLARSQSRAGFLNGQFGLTGWLSFFPCCLAWKTPLELFLLLGLAGWACWVYRGARMPGGQLTPSSPSGRLYATAPLLALVVVFWAFALRSNLNIGHRHILPTYPPLFILAGAVGLWFRPSPAQQDKRATTTLTAPVGPKVLSAVRIVILLAMAGTILESLLIWPHYLAYFNVLAGGPRNGYRRLVDSSLDWGQDLKELKGWMDDHAADSEDSQRVYLSYFGTARAAYYGIKAQTLPNYFPHWEPHIPRHLTGGLYCTSASMMQSVYSSPYRGRWNVIFEADYQTLRGMVLKYQRLAADPDAARQLAEKPMPPDVRDAFRRYELLRFARLASFLRQREPDDQVGYSIMIYRLNDADLEKAIEGPPCELWPAPET